MYVQCPKREPFTAKVEDFHNKSSIIYIYLNINIYILIYLTYTKEEICTLRGRQESTTENATAKLRNIRRRDAQEV